VRLLFVVGGIRVGLGAFPMKVARHEQVGASIRGLVRRETGFFCASVRLRQNAYTPQKLGLNFCLTLMLRLMGGNHALHYESICLGLPVGTPARVCLRPSQKLG
jgi:hypothetical protein